MVNIIFLVQNSPFIEQNNYLRRGLLAPWVWQEIAKGIAVFVLGVAYRRTRCKLGCHSWSESIITRLLHQGECLVANERIPSLPDFRVHEGQAYRV